MPDEKTFEGWAILELMGHRQLAGEVREATIAGAAFIRLDIPEVIQGLRRQDAATQFYAPHAVFSLTPCTEETARAVAGRAYNAPTQQLSLPPGQRVVVHEAIARCTSCEHPAEVHDFDPHDDAYGPCSVDTCDCRECRLPEPEDLPF